MPAITVSELAIAPVKGLRLTPVEELELRTSGAVGDRAFVVVDEADHALLLTARTPTLVQVVQRWDPVSGVLTLGFADGSEVAAAPSPGEPVSTANYEGRRISGRLTSGPHSEALSEHLGRPVRLVALDQSEVGADDFPVTLMSSASVAALGKALDGRPPDARRFRMTITVDGTEPWEEHGWAGREVDVGEAQLRIADPVPRCVVTTRDPEKGRRDVPVLQTLAKLRGKKNVTFGVWCEVTRPGRVRRGDPVVAVGLDNPTHPA
ncbi:MAG TPA: MOSC domain-containing protein [Thermoleophilaceae bacterium]|nr:MOSC domain-containing protein [Thermoleophilaceae bacterium]